MPDQATEAAFATAAAGLAADYVKNLVSGANQLLRTHLLPHLKDFEDYFSSTYKKCNTVKIIIDRNQLHRLTDVYVKGYYSIGDKDINDDGIAQLVRDNHRVVVQGLGGIGKTMLLKYVWLAIFAESAGRIPVFVELRRLNEFKAPNLITYLRGLLTPSGHPLTTSQFETLLRAGRFIFLFDAFDEVSDEIRPSLEKQILELAYVHSKCGMLVTGRSDPRFGSWEAFRVFQAKPFNKGQIEEVIKLAPFEKKVKSKFLTEVLGKKYSKYESFLSTPLLALMMLITYDQFADIPEKVHIFYRYAFQTLYTLHDAGKETFRRPRKSGLSEDDFCKVFSLFCLSSYLKRDFIFSRKDVLEEFSQAAKRANIVIDEVLFLSEVCESVNLMYEEGNRLSFTHRSFQEYFSADALTGHLAASFVQLAGRIPLSSEDSVFAMSYDMNSDLVEESYLVPMSERYSSNMRTFLTPRMEFGDLVQLLDPTMLVFQARTSGGASGAMSEFFYSSGFVDFIKRGLSFLPEGRGVQWDDPGITLGSGAEVRKFVTKLAKVAGWKARGMPAFSALELVSGRCEFQTDEEHIYVAEIKDLVSMISERAAIKRLIEADVVRQRALAITLDRALRKVRGRSKQRASTLDELLSDRTSS
ncbi:MAG TPA: NACHT domain-containing protein [Devosia sp.]|nr:NACHT domain-containing protein [Devosia sp.]